MIFRMACGVGAITTLTSCSSYYSVITIDNKTSVSLERVAVHRDDGTEIEFGRVGAHDRVSFYHHFPGEPTQDQSPLLAFAMNGRHHSIELCYYAGFSPFQATITVTEAGINRICH